MTTKILLMKIQRMKARMPFIFYFVKDIIVEEKGLLWLIRNIRVLLV